MSRKYKFHDNKDWQFWQQHNKPLEIKDQEMFHKSLDYIHQNPVVAGFVTKAEDWKHSSARDFYGMKGLAELSYSYIQWHKYAKHKAKLHTCANAGAGFVTNAQDVQAIREQTSKIATQIATGIMNYIGSH